MKLSIIIVNFDTQEFIVDLLKSIEGKINCPYEIIIVDNGSKQKLDETQFKSFKNTKIFTLTENHGFGAGNNYGAKKATGEILWLLNPDTLIPDQSINKAIEFLENNDECGIVSPLLFNNMELTELQDDMIANFQSLGTLISRKVRPEFKLEQEYQEVDVVVGASILIRGELFHKIDGFDEKFFMFMEDDDLCYRVKKMGLKICIYNRSKIIHLKGKSIKRNVDRKKMYYRSQDYFWQKHHGALSTLIMKIVRFPIKFVNTL